MTGVTAPVTSVVGWSDRMGSGSSLILAPSSHQQQSDYKSKLRLRLRLRLVSSLRSRDSHNNYSLLINNHSSRAHKQKCNLSLSLNPNHNRPRRLSKPHQDHLFNLVSLVSRVPQMFSVLVTWSGIRTKPGG